MFKVSKNYLVTHYEAKERQDGGKYYLVRILADEGKSVDLFSQEDLSLVAGKTYYFNILISVGAKTYINILSVDTVK